MQEKGHAQDSLDRYARFSKDFEENREMLLLAREAQDKALEAETIRALASLEKSIAARKWEALFDGEADGNACYLEVHAGAGGTESQDWAEMLLRMYERWASSHNYKTEILSRSDGEEAGIKSATLAIQGLYAYGWLKKETGVHRLVRISPFDAGSRRHTSFCKVGVYPEIDDSIEIHIEESDVRIDTYRASGAGGQHVNTTDSAVRMTHLPSSIVVQCQNERSQHKNRATAWAMLRARLYEVEIQRQQEEKDAMRGAKNRYRMGAADTILYFAALPACQGFAHRRRKRPAQRCS